MACSQFFRDLAVVAVVRLTGRARARAPRGRHDASPPLRQSGTEDGDEHDADSIHCTRQRLGEEQLAQRTVAAG
jgi:hypothetical protein